VNAKLVIRAEQMNAFRRRLATGLHHGPQFGDPIINPWASRIL